MLYQRHRLRHNGKERSRNRAFALWENYMRGEKQQVYKLWEMMLPTNDFLQKGNMTHILDARAQTLYRVNLRKRSPSLTFAIFKGIKCVSFQNISTKIEIKIFILVGAYMRYVFGKYRNIRTSECYR